MTNLVSLCDVALGNEEDAEKVFGIQAPDSNITAGRVAADHYRYVCEQLADKFPALKTIAITLRGSLSASHNTWSGVLWHSGNFYRAPIYDILPIVDRGGGGDSFMGGLLQAHHSRRLQCRHRHLPPGTSSFQAVADWPLPTVHLFV